MDQLILSYYNAFYMSKNGSICPVCKSRDIESNGPMQVDGDSAWIEIACNHCRSTWQDVYTLSGIDNLFIPDIREE